MVRSFIKWDHQLSDDEDISDVFQEAFRKATSEPCGPVYLTLPREKLWDKSDIPRKKLPVIKPETPPKADEKLLVKAAELLLKANNP